MAIAFLATSVVPVYFVWLMPELFNFSLVLYAVFFWAYKEVAGDRLARTRRSRILTGPASDYIAALLVGARDVLEAAAPARARADGAARGAPPPVDTRRRHAGHLRRGHRGVVRAERRDHRRVQLPGRRSQDVLSFTGFPFANTWETFDNIGPVRGREDLMVGDVLVNTHSGTVLRHNLWYFLVGRNAGLLPYFFPGMLALVLFLFSKQKHLWQWLALATIAVVVVMHVFVWPFTWNGGGGPVGSRYFLPFYALFLVLIPATAGVGRGDDGVRRRRAVYGAARAEPVLRVAAARASTPNRARCGCCRSS